MAMFHFERLSIILDQAWEVAFSPSLHGTPHRPQPMRGEDRAPYGMRKT